MEKIIGRKSEINILETVISNNKSELIAVYGRRRVGKTFLVREYFKKQLVFEVIGVYRGGLKDQIRNFVKQLQNRGYSASISKTSTWFDIFTCLEKYLDSLKSNKKKVVFIDDFPWFDTARSKFLMAFENFWNQYATKRDDLIVVICGSAASYMVKEIINNKGGLHNRITQRIRLLPFNLFETEMYLKSRGIRYTQYDILQIYMAVGGVPHYLEKLQKGLSVAQNIDQLCFNKDGILKEEFDLLFVSLFDNPALHKRIVECLSGCRKGITRNELIKMCGVNSGGDFSDKLDELIASGFLTQYTFYKNKNQKTLYRLADEYCWFYLKYIKHNKSQGAGTWQRLSKKQSYVSWSGFSFETICLKHVEQIKKALRIDAIYSQSSCWFNEKAQIDLLIDRDDNVINLCEIKFFNAPFVIDKSYYSDLKNKITEFYNSTKTRKNLFLTLLTTYGITQNQYSTELIQKSLDMSCLFEN